MAMAFFMPGSGVRTKVSGVSSAWSFWIELRVWPRWCIGASGTNGVSIRIILSCVSYLSLIRGRSSVERGELIEKALAGFQRRLYILA